LKIIFENLSQHVKPIDWLAADAEELIIRPTPSLHSHLVVFDNYENQRS